MAEDEAPKTAPLANLRDCGHCRFLRVSGKGTTRKRRASCSKHRSHCFRGIKGQDLFQPLTKVPQ